MPPSNVEFAIEGFLARITFNRPETRNALTWAMYEALADACARAADHPDVRVLVIGGAGGAFAAGTDIAQFRDFRTGGDGVAYERRLDAVLDRIERLARPTIAAIDGPAVGGGCAIALACDFRICSDRARLGVPIARTLGNCLSLASLARLVDTVGTARARELVLTGRLLGAAEALAAGLATRVVPAARLADEVCALAADLAACAPSTIAATKAGLLRLRDHRRPPPGAADDLVADCYTSAEFQEGVAAFLDGRPPRWSRRPEGVDPA